MRITMPRKRRGFEELPPRTIGNLVERLVDELKSNRPAGQPLIEEEEFPHQETARDCHLG